MIILVLFCFFSIYGMIKNLLWICLILVELVSVGFLVLISSLLGCLKVI